MLEVGELLAVHSERSLVIDARSIELIAEISVALEIVLPVVIDTLRLETSVGGDKAVEEIVGAVEEVLEAAAAEAAGEGAQITFGIAVVDDAGAADAVGKYAGGVQYLLGQMAAVISENLVVTPGLSPLLGEGVEVGGVE